MKRFILLITLLGFASQAYAFEETVKIYADQSDGSLILRDNDGFIDWEQARNYQGPLDRVPADIEDNTPVRSDKNSGFYRIYRASILFDISALPPDAMITKATLNLHQYPAGNNNNTKGYLTTHIREETLSLQSKDWMISNFGDYALAEPFVLNTAGYRSIELNSGGLIHIKNSGDKVIFGVITEYDFNNVDPGTIVSSLAWYSANNDASVIPYLEVTYTLPEEPTLDEQLDSLVTAVEEGNFSDRLKKVYLANIANLKLIVEKSYGAAINQIDAFLKKLNNEKLSGDVATDEKTALENAGEAVKQEIETLASDEDMAFGVPLITQVASPYPPESSSWAGNIFASSGPFWCGTTIAQCGCAITSLVMLARNAGVFLGIDGTEVTPGNLNSWLNSNNGYTPSGGVLWSLATQYFANSDGTGYVTFDHHNTASTTMIERYLRLGNPVIAFKERVGHYLVLTGILEEGGYKVNDPFWYNTETTNQEKDAANHVQSYGGSIDKANLFTTSSTPQPIPGWIEIHLGSPAELRMIDSQGRQAGFDPVTGDIVLDIPGSSYDQTSFIATSDDVPSDIHKEKVLMIKNPTDALYELQVVGTGEGDYSLTVGTGGGSSAFEVNYVFDSTAPGAVDRYFIDMPGPEGRNVASERLNELADSKMVEQPAVADRLREIAERLGSTNVTEIESDGIQFPWVE